MSTTADKVYFICILFVLLTFMFLVTMNLHLPLLVEALSKLTHTYVGGCPPSPTALDNHRSTAGVHKVTKYGPSQPLEHHRRPQEVFPFTPIPAHALLTAPPPSSFMARGGESTHPTAPAISFSRANGRPARVGIRGVFAVVLGGYSWGIRAYSRAFASHMLRCDSKRLMLKIMISPSFHHSFAHRGPSRAPPPKNPNH